MDNNWISICKGRLTNAYIAGEARLPKVLPNKDNYTRLVIHDTHKRLFHAGVSHTLAQVRSEYWILKRRASVKERIPTTPSLPSQSLTQCHPFIHLRPDYLGPLYIRKNSARQKVLVCIFTCLMVRAVHLELIRFMTSEQFLLCMRSFIAQYGTPHSILSDNASQLQLERNLIAVNNDTDVQDYEEVRNS